MITHSKTKGLAHDALLIALVFVAAKAINIPTPIGGVINISDSLILMISVISLRERAVLVSGLGAFLAEVFSPFAIFAPATLIIKALMAFVSSTVIKSKRIKSRNLSLLLAFILAESVMIFGYFIYQAYFLNLGVALASLDIVNNLIQAGVSILIAFVLTNSIERI